VDAAGRPCPYARRPAQGRLARVSGQFAVEGFGRYRVAALRRDAERGDG
jgi:hypothetical protein